MNGQEALSHKWFKTHAAKQREETKSGPNEEKISDEVVSRLRSFKGVSTFKKAAMNLLVKTASEDEVKDLRAQF